MVKSVLEIYFLKALRVKAITITNSVTKMNFLPHGGISKKNLYRVHMMYETFLSQKFHPRSILSS